MKIKIFQILLSVMLLGSTVAFSEDNYFPNRAFDNREDLDDFISEWYTRQLQALEESSIYKQSNDKKVRIFRFTWLRTFHHPISIRIVINNHGSGLLFAKMASGAGGYDPGRLKKSIKKSLIKLKYKIF